MGFGRGGFGFVPGRPPSSKDEAISASPRTTLGPTGLRQLDEGSTALFVPESKGRK